MTNELRIGLFLLALFSGSIAPAADLPKTRLGFIGLELDGAWSFMEQAATEPEAELVAVADPHDDLIVKPEAALPAGIRFFADHEPMLGEMKPDAVLLTAPNDEHLEIMRACARRHIHVWFQKPMASTLADAIEMDRLARETGITLMVNNWTLWLSDHQALADRARSGDLGAIQRVFAQNGFVEADGFRQRRGGGTLFYRIEKQPARRAGCAVKLQEK